MGFMTEDEEIALHEYLTRHLENLEGITGFFTNLDWNTLHKIANESTRDILKIKVDKIFDDKVFGICVDRPNIDCATLATHFAGLAPDLNVEANAFFENLDLTSLIPDQFTNPDLALPIGKNLSQSAHPIIKREHRPSLDLIQTKSTSKMANESHSGKPTQPAISHFNALASPLTTPFTKTIPSDGLSSKTSIIANKQPLSPQRLTSPARPTDFAVRRGSSVNATLPLYIRQQISSPGVAASAIPNRAGFEQTSSASEFTSIGKVPGSLPSGTGPLSDHTSPISNAPMSSSNGHTAKVPALPESTRAPVQAHPTDRSEGDHVPRRVGRPPTPPPPQNEFLISSTSLKVFLDDSTDGTVLPAELQYTRQTVISAGSADYLSTENLESDHLSRLGESNGGPIHSDYCRY